MLRSSGQWLRQELGGFLPMHWDPTIMYARSTDIDRTYESAENLLQALFPSPSPRGGGNTANVMNIWTIEKGFDDLDVAQNVKCPALIAACADIVNSTAWANHKASIEPLQQTLADAFNVPVADQPDIASWLEVLRARKAQGLDIVVSEETYNAVMQAATWEIQAIYNNQTVHQYTSSQLVAEIVALFKAHTTSVGSDRLFTLFSAHDTTVAPLLASLQVNWTIWPHYASNILLTLNVDQQNNYYVQMLHDRVPTQMGDCAMMCPFQQFLDITASTIIENRDEKCQSVKAPVFSDPEIGFLCG